VFILYAIVVGLVLGLVLGGRPIGLASLEFRWGWLVLLGFAVQVVLFWGPVAERVGALGAPIYVLSTGAVVLALLRNRMIPGLPVVALGALANLAAIVANGGYMPASRAALAALGGSAGGGYSNSAVVPDPALLPLTDIFALPRALPFANVFSVGDVLIGIGVALTIALAMRRSQSERPAEALTAH
jgi:hypothetical protein